MMNYLIKSELNLVSEFFNLISDIRQVAVFSFLIAYIQ
ncbi:Putative uncharacterized protein [Moritella viscosa]|nr:Putative uncharacterized protein [Moritella viscosa]